MKFSFVDYDQSFWLILFLSFGVVFFSFHKSWKFKKVKILLVFRIIVIGIIIFLFLNPKLTLVKTNNREQKWNIYIDESLSMAYHSYPSISSLISGIDELIHKLSKKQIPLNIYGFGTNLDTSLAINNTEFKDISTNIGQVIEQIINESDKNLAGSIIITDGQINQGSEIIIDQLDKIKPINIIGIGDKNPLVDVSIQSINAPPAIIKGENAEIEVSVNSYGTIDNRINVTLNNGKKLLGSKVLTVSGNGSINKIRFMINPDQTGEVEYKVQVSALPDEINILNNKQIVPIQVLKNNYKICIITGSPNFNTRIIKDVLSGNSKFEIEHFYLTRNGYSEKLKIFWDTKYDLILFDNHPVDLNSSNWDSFLRIFAKKILSQKTSFAVIMGNDVNKNSLMPYLNLMDLKINQSVIKLDSEHKWNFTKNWNKYFPFHSLDLISIENDYPPLYVDLEIDSAGAVVLAEFTISDVNLPLILLGEKDPLRYMVFVSPNLYQLYYKIQNDQSHNIAKQTLDPIFSWLMRTGHGEDFYFRSGKNSYQQGERVKISGKPIKETEIATEGYIHIYSKGKKVNVKPVVYNNETGHYEGQFWASQPGRLDYDIELVYGDKSLIVGEGSLQIQESQIELNRVYLNEEFLRNLSESTGGTFYGWDKRFEILNNIDKKTNTQKILSRITIHNSWWLFFALIFFLTLEWLYRRKVGLI
ncbi:MAG: hypothetical protein CMG60_02305 [Candidatus Marinimicrobia bacterium]|nr:hypothetical protein [Candidatus Neomarinimicrobiota bacterium]